MNIDGRTARRRLELQARLLQGPHYCHQAASSVNGDPPPPVQCLLRADSHYFVTQRLHVNSVDL